LGELTSRVYREQSDLGGTGIPNRIDYGDDRGKRESRRRRHNGGLVCPVFEQLLHPRSEFVAFDGSPESLFNTAISAVRPSLLTEELSSMPDDLRRYT
jgi:hypothetical protein